MASHESAVAEASTTNVWDAATAPGLLPRNPTGAMQMNALSLLYEDDDIETQFRWFLVPRLPRFLLPMYILIAIVLFLVWTSLPDKSDLSAVMGFINLIDMLILSIIQAVLTVLEKCYVTSTEGRARLIAISNTGLIVTILLNAVLSTVAYYASVKESCGEFLVEPKSKESRHFNCSLRYNADNVQLLVVVVLLHNIPFAYTLLIAIYNVIVHLTAWLLVRPIDDKSVVVVQAAFYVVFASVLLCAIRRDHEIAQREHFEKFFVLERHVRLLRRRRCALLQFSESVLPASLLGKVSSHAVVADQVDHSPHATMVVIGVHGLEDAGRTMLDDKIAKFLAGLQENCEQAARAAKLDIIRVIGDHFAAVGNLLEEKKDSTAAALRLCMRMMGLHDDYESPLGIRAAIDVGSLYGRFVGTNYVRYDVSGPAFEQCYRAWLHGTSGDVVVTATVASDAAYYPGYTFSMLIAGNEGGSSGSSDASFLSTIGPRGALYTVKQHSLPDGLPDGHPVQNEPVNNSGTKYNSGYVGLVRMLDPSTNEGRKTSTSTESAKKELSDVTRRVWCGLLLEFTDPTDEARYVEHRQASLAGRARFVWTAYAAFLAGLLLLAVADLRGPNAPFAVVLLVITIFLALIVGTLPAVWCNDEWRRYGLAWSILGSLVPLLAVIAVALTRPSAVGNDVRVLFTLGCLVRSYTFPNVRLQLVLTPVLVGLASLQYLLPYAAMRPVYAYYAMALWSLFVDVERDSSLRAAFFAHDQAAFVLVSLREEERLRDGLIRSTLPGPVHRRVVSGYSPIPELVTDRARLSTVADTTVCLLNFRQSDALSMSMETKSKASQSTSSPNGSFNDGGGGRYLREEKSHRVTAEDLVVGVPDAVFGIVESVLAHETEVAVVTVAGDQVLLAAPLVTSLRNAESAQELKEDALIATTRCALLIASRLRQLRNESADVAKVTMSALLEFDTTSQYLRVSDFPRFSVFGLATRRLLALGASIPLPDGVFATERAWRTLASAIEAIWDGAPPIRSAPLEGRWAVRGVGVVRLVRLELTM